MSACDRPHTIVLCHNVNCAGAISPELDDTEEALRESFALPYRGRPAIDGLEIDLLWNESDGGLCQVAHEVGTIDDPMTPIETAEIIAEHLEQPDPISWNGEVFYVVFELKGLIDGAGSPHTHAQAEMHAECALDAYERLEQAAIDTGRRLEITFDSTSPNVLGALTKSQRWPGKSPSDEVVVRLSGDFSDPTSLGVIEIPGLRDLMNAIDPEELDNVVVHSSWINYGGFHAFRSLDVDITIWMFSATADTFAALERVEPEYVVTSEALLMRRWLEY